MSAPPVRVLIAEDNPTDALLLKESLAGVELADFNITHVETLAECLKVLQTETFDAVLIDLGLPDSSGLDTFRSLRDHCGSAVIMVLTGFEDEHTGVQAVRMGAEDYLMKSQIRTSLLGRIVRYAIERNSLKKQLEEKREREAHEREVRLVSRLADSKTRVSATMHSASSLREGRPDAFADFLLEYSRLLDVSLEVRTYRVEQGISDALSDLGNELGLLRASPRDVVEIHSLVLKEKIRGLSMQKAQALLEEGRVAVLELMGYVANFYRTHYVAPPRKGMSQ